MTTSLRSSLLLLVCLLLTGCEGYKCIDGKLYERLAFSDVFVRYGTMNECKEIKQ